jgi:hypothetical protein
MFIIFLPASVDGKVQVSGESEEVRTGVVQLARIWFSYVINS